MTLRISPIQLRHYLSGTYSQVTLCRDVFHRQPPYMEQWNKSLNGDCFFKKVVNESWDPLPVLIRRKIPFIQKYRCRDHLVQPFTLKMRNLTCRWTIYMPKCFFFPGGFCVGDCSYFLTYGKEKVFIPFSPISLGILLNISWEFEQLPESCQYENSRRSIIVKGLKKHAMSRETFKIGNQMLRESHTAHTPGFHLQATPTFLFSGMLPHPGKSGFVFLCAKNSVEKSPHLKRKCSSFLSLLSQTS